MVLPALVGAMSGAQTADAGEESDWPPQAWHDGDVSQLPLVDLALLASDSLPTPDNRRELATGLAPLEEMPPEHTELVRVVLEGLAQARWHQVQAMRDLSDEQRAIVAAADPDAPVPDGWDGVMAAVDHGELGKALIALEASSTRALEIYESLHRDAPPGVAQSLAEAIGLPLPASSPAMPDASSALTTELVSQVTDAGLTPDELTHLQGSLDEIPPEARSAIHLILDGLLPFAAGAPTDPGPALVELGAAVDAARETLLIWSTAAMAQQVHHVLTGQGIEIPDADADRPPLHFGVPRLREPDAPLPPAPSLPDALRELALAFGDQETAQNRQEKAQAVMDVLPQSQQDALAQMFSQAARYMRAQEAASQAPMPSALAQDPGLLSGWIDSLDEGFPEPGSMEADALLDARSFLEAQLEAALSREDLMTAIQDAAEEFTPKPQSSSSPPTPLPDEPEPPAAPAPMPMSGPAQEAGVECLEELGIIDNLRPYLAIAPCAGDTQWNWSEHNAVFVIDMGGNDTYTGPFAGVADSGSGSSLAVHLDLGGSDFYNATGHDCALGAACSTGALAVLVDWEGDRSVSENLFISESRSQGFAIGSATGMIVERAGYGSDLASRYEAGDSSQGSGGAGALLATTGSVGALLRMVGSQSMATGEFTAGNVVQGARPTTSTAVAALINVAGTDARSQDRYEANEHAQGATITATFFTQGRESPLGASIFADTVGPGGRSDDIYLASDRSRAYGPGAYFLDLLLPEHADEQLVDGLPSMGGGVNSSVTISAASTGPRSSSNDTYVLTQGDRGHGMVTAPESPTASVRSTLFLDVGGNDTYDSEHVCLAEISTLATLPTNDCRWSRPDPEGPGNPTGIDTDALRDEDGDFIPTFVEDLLGASDQDPDTPHATGRSALIDAGAHHGFLNETYAFALTLTGDTTYGTGFSAGVLLDLAGANTHLGRTAAATSPLAPGSNLTFPPAAQNLLSFTLDLEGDDVYRSSVNGSMGFAAGGAAGILFDMGGDDDYHGISFTQGAAADGGIGILVDLKSRLVTDASEEVNRFRADGDRSQGYGEGGGVALLVADGDHNEFHDGAPPAPGQISDAAWDLLLTVAETEGLPGQVKDAMEQVRETPENVEDHEDLQPLFEILQGFLDENYPEHSAEVETGVRQQGTGFSLNLGGNVEPDVEEEDGNYSVHTREGTNEGPNILGWGVEGDGVEWTSQNSQEFPLLQAGRTYMFNATASDADGDRIRFCWTFEDRVCMWPEGRGTVESRMDFQWDVVPTDARRADEGIHERMEFHAGLAVNDDGGKGDRSDLLPIPVENVPLEINGDLRGPSIIRAGEGAAFQLPFSAEGRNNLPTPLDDAVEVDWDDGSMDRFTAIAVDWAARSNDGKISLQGGIQDGFDAPPRVDSARPLSNAIDPAGFTRMVTGQDNFDLRAPATILVDFAGVRHIRQVALNASLDDDDGNPVQLAVEGVRTDGTTFPLGSKTVQLTHSAWNRHEWNLGEFPDLRGLLVRQLVPPDEQKRFIGDLEDRPLYQFRINELSARGPGAVKTWDVRGSYSIDYTVLDQFQGRNGTVETIHVRGAPGEDTAPPSIELADVAGRGPLMHASVAFNQMYEFRFNVADLQNDEEFCVEIERAPEGEVEIEGVVERENEQSCHGSGNGKRASMAWDTPGSYNVTATLYRDGMVAGDPLHLSTIHVEEAIDLPGILFITFNRTVTTWYEGIEYQGIVDAGGDDRYYGRVASSIPIPTTDQSPGVPLPGFVLDAGGHDAYLQVRRGGPLGSQVQPRDLDRGAPLHAFPSGNAIGWVDCDQDGQFGFGDCVFLDSDGSGTNSVGDIFLVDMPGSDVPPGGVITANSRGVGTSLTSGQFRPVYEDVDGNGVYNLGDTVYLDDPAGRGSGLGVLSQGDIQVSGDGFGTMRDPGLPSTPLAPVPLNFCFHDINENGAFNGGEPVYLSAGNECSAVQSDDVRTFIPPALGRTQAFATHFGVALLMDAGGDDVYVAAGEAQAAATRGGAAALVSLGGSDHFNPVPANHPAVAGASATEERPTDYEVFRSGRAVGPGPDMVQGAAEDGVAILITTGGALGGAGLFHAGDRSQGHGTHQVPRADHYVFPGADSGCNPMLTPPAGSGAGVPNFDHMAALCHLGLTNLRDPANANNLQTYYNPLAAAQNQQQAQNRFWCPNTSPFSPLPWEICSGNEPDTVGLTSFLASGPRYSPGLGAAVRLDGPVMYHAGTSAQASAGPDGRGLLLNLAGPSALLTKERGQAFSESGLAGALLGGSSVLRLGGSGQGAFRDGDLESGPPIPLIGDVVPPGPEAGLSQAGRAAVLLTVGNRDARCEAEESCGDSTFDIDLGELPAAPSVTVDAPDSGVFTIRDFDVNVDLGGSESSGHDVAAFAAAFPDQDGDGLCTGPPLAPPALVHEGHEEGSSFSINLDLSRIVAGTDPLLPAGCTEVHVFARGLEGGWGHDSDSVLVLPPPRIPLDPVAEPIELRLGTQRDLEVRVPEPLVQVSPPAVSFRMVPEGGDVEAPGADLGGWQLVDDRLEVDDWAPGSLAQGEYRLQVRFDWNGAGSGDWVDVVRVRVPDLGEPSVNLHDEFQNPHLISNVPGASTPITMHGNASNAATLAFRMRFVDGDGNPADDPQPLRQGFSGACTSSEETEQVANLDGALQESDWDVTLCLPSDVFAGTFVVEYNVNYDDLEQGWEPFTTANGLQQAIFLVQDPPRVESVTTPDGFSGSRAAGHQADPVGLCVQVRHAGQGVGVAAQDVMTSVLGWDAEGNLSRLHVERAPALDPEEGVAGRCPGASGPREVFGYQWHDEGLIEPAELEAGVYYVYVFVRDGIGGLYDSNPGVGFPIDRDDPTLDQPGLSLPKMAPWPDGEAVRQQALKPGDELPIGVRVEDENLDVVKAFVELVDGTRWAADLVLDPESARHGGTLVIPQDPQVDDEGMISLHVEAVDRAGNNALMELGRERFHEAGFDFAKTQDGQDNITVVERSRSVEVEWVLDRFIGHPGDGMQAILQDASGNDLIASDDVESVAGEHPTYRMQFDDLDPDTTYHVALRLWDAANFTLQSDPILVRTLGLPIGSDVNLTTAESPTYSGIVPLDGHLLAGASTVTGHLSIHVDDRHAEPAEVWSCDANPGGTPATANFPVTVSRGQRADFCFQWDSRDRVQASTGADEVTLHMRFSDGSVSLWDNLTLRIDNTKPGLALDVFGPEANQGWYNGTINAGVVVTDDTSPFLYLVEAEHEGKTTGPLDQEAVMLNEDGLHELNFTVRDGAVPPNVAHLEATIRVDRTLPSLNVTRGLPERWTNETLVPFQVTASDAGSGLDGYRVRVGDGPWAAWTKAAPDGTSLVGLPDGEHWIDVQVRDAARNVRLESLSVILDRTPPELVDARWVGWTQESSPQPVLHVVVQDMLDGEGMPSGIDAIRFAFNETGPWTDWTAMGSSGTFAINGTTPGANETHAGVVWMQLRDRASNVGDAVQVDEPFTERHEVDPGVDIRDAPASALLRAPSYAPERGTPETPFLFSVRVHPLGGAMPDPVVLNVAGNTYNMEPEGPTLEGGARLYTAIVTLPPTDFEAPHSFTVRALHGDHTVESSPQPGPMVVKLGDEPDSLQVQDDTKGFQIPELSFVVLTLVLVMLSVLARDRLSMYTSWRRKK